MAIEHLFLSTTAVMMLVVAISGSGFAAELPRAGQIVASALRSPKADLVLEGVLAGMDAKDLKIMVILQKEEKRTFKVMPDAEITKNNERVELSTLARGDRLTLHLAGTGSDVVAKIQAMPSR